MNEPSFERRAQLWLEAGPTRLPDDAIGLMLDAIADVPQQPDLVARLPRRLRASRASILATAAVVTLVVAGSSVVVLRSVLQDTAGPRPADHLLHGFPEVQTYLERSGGPATSDERVALGRLSVGNVFVIAASCEGGDQMTVAVYDPSIINGEPENGAPIEPEPTQSLEVACDQQAQHMQVSSLMTAADLELVLDVTKSTTWQIAVGEYPHGATREPTFPAPIVTDGWYALMEVPAMLVLGHPGPGVAVQVPEGASEIGILVQCSGDPITVTRNPGGNAIVVDCTDAAAQQRVTFPADGLGFDVHAGSDGIAWVRMTPEADGEITTVRPSAPPLPPELATVRFAQGDGQYVAFGSLGTADQSVVPVAGAPLALAGGDVVGVAVPADDGTGMRLEAWSIEDGTSIRVLAQTDGRIYQSWVDATHQQVFYGVTMDDQSAEWRRVGLDGSGEALVVRMASTVVPTGIAAGLAIDDTVFIVEWCPTLGPCVRHVHDTLAGTTREVDPGGDRTCHLIGVIDGQVVATSGQTCDGPQGPSITVQSVDGGERRALPVPLGQAVLAMAPSGPVVVVAQDRDAQTIYRVTDLDGTEARELARIDHPGWIPPLPADLRLPAGWVLLGGPLADTPGNRNLGRAIPRLLNLETGELIELVNLPHSDR